METNPANHEDLLLANQHIRALARSLSRDAATADDIEQDAWAAALRTDQRVERPKAFFATLVRRAASNRRRGSERRKRREQAVARPETSPEPGPFDLAVFEERRRELIALIHELPDAQRDVLLARYWEGLEPAEIASRNDESAQAVRQRLYRAHETLRARLDRHSDNQRKAWLGPLVGAPWPTLAVTASKVAVGAGGLLLLQKLLLAAVVGVTIGVGAFAVDSWTRPAPATSTNGTAAIAQPRSSDIAADSTGSTTGEGSVLANPGAAPTAAPALTPPPAPRLVDAAGQPVANIAYWRGPLPQPATRYKLDRASGFTNPDGTFTVGNQAGDWLWFAVTNSLAFAVPVTDLTSGSRIHLPRLRKTSVVVQGLPNEASWRISCYPTRTVRNKPWTMIDSVMDMTQPNGHVFKAVRRVAYASGTGAEVATFMTIDSQTYGFRAKSAEYEVELSEEFHTNADLVVASAGAKNATYPYATFEEDGVTPIEEPVDVGLRQPNTTKDRNLNRWSTFDGKGTVALEAGTEFEGRSLVFILRSGEVFVKSLTDPTVQPGKLIRLIEGQGKQPLARIPLAGTAKQFTIADVRYVHERRLHDPKSTFDYNPLTTGHRVAAWLFRGDLIVHTNDGRPAPGQFLIHTDTGRFAMQRGKEVHELERSPLDPIDLLALVKRHVEPVGAQDVEVHYQIRLDDVPLVRKDEWIATKTWKLRREDGRGWRYYKFTLGESRAVPTAICHFLPKRSQGRLVIEFDDGPSDVVLPLRPK